MGLQLRASSISLFLFAQALVVGYFWLVRPASWLPLSSCLFAYGLIFWVVKSVGCHGLALPRLCLSLLGSTGKDELPLIFVVSTAHLENIHSSFPKKNKIKKSPYLSRIPNNSNASAKWANPYPHPKPQTRGGP